MTPTFSLGCGTWGGSKPPTDKRQLPQPAQRQDGLAPPGAPQWFRVPSDTYFNAGAIDSLREIESRQALVVMAPDAERRGVADEVRRHLSAEAVHVFSEVDVEPGEATIRRGVEVVDELQPDLIVAVGGGSVIDAAKVMRLFHESPGLDIDGLTCRSSTPASASPAGRGPQHKVRLAALPTTAGTGSEVSPAAVLSIGDRKVTLVDYSLVPDTAIVDPKLTLTLPADITADTGVDALTTPWRRGCRSSPRRSPTRSACRRST